MNINLWTLQPEFYCYLLLAGLMAVGLFYRIRFMTACLIAVAVAFILAEIPYGLTETGDHLSSSVIVFYFFAGAVAFHWRDHIRLSRPLFFATVVASLALFSVNGTAIVAAPFAIYAMIYVGMTRVWMPNFYRGGDYSYGIYLYGFPIEQTLVHFFPSLRVWWVIAIVAGAATTAFAVFSWHKIEKPALRLKKILAPKRTLSTSAPQGAAAAMP